MSKLDESVTIHFKEDSIPSLRRGPLTKESKDAIKALFLELAEEIYLKKHQRISTAKWLDDFKKAVQAL